MTDLATPLPAGTPVVTVGGKAGPIPDATGADAMGLVTASPNPLSLLGRLKAIADAVGGGGSGGGDASAANQATEIAQLTAIVNALTGTLVVSASALPLPVGAATQTTLAALLAKTIAAPATEAKQDAALALLARPGVGDLTAVPAGSVNGTLVGARPAGARAMRFFLPTGTAVTFTVAAAAPAAAPVTFTVSAADTGPNWDEPLADGVNVYVTARTGAPLFRYI